MKILNKEIKYIELENGFIAESYYNGVETEIWIFHKDYGVKMLMYGLINEIGERALTHYLTGIEDYIEIYKERFMN